MADITDFFWELFEAVSGGTGEGITDALNSLAKSDRAKLDTYFSEVIDQSSFGTEDYNRLRKFLVDLFATHRTLASQSVSSTDPHTLTNSNLDELFRSFGYPYSSQLRGFDENPLEQKVQFFLDLVNLYKVKGTPQSLVDVLQYYGVTEIDIYEFVLKLSSPGNLIFQGKAVAGTSVNPNELQIPYANLTATDPHWLYTAQQILNLNNTNKINLPSQTPYLGVQPAVDLDGAEFSIMARYVQDQYAYWLAHGTVPPPNAEITFIGEIKSLLELYLSTIYMFNKLYSAGVEQDPCDFLCYDGTSTDSLEIVTEFTTLSTPPIRRCDLNTNVPPFGTVDPSLIVSNGYCADSKLAEYFDEFTRSSTTNFLVDKNSAGVALAAINPTLKTELDNAGEPLEVLYSLLKDLADWVRTNIGYGFINFGFILFGINEFFTDLKPVIEFFKPYRARLLLLESLQIKNRLFNTIKVEDSMYADIDVTVADYLTGNSSPCCTSDSTSLPLCVGDTVTKCQREQVITPPAGATWRGLWTSATTYAVNDIVASGLLPGDFFICTQAHVSTPEQTKPGYGTEWTLMWALYSQMVCTDSTGVNASVYSRETYDCGSYFDIGAVTDLPQDIFIQYEEDITDNLRCPAADGTGFVVSEIMDSEYTTTNSTSIASGSDSVNVIFPAAYHTADYSIGATLRNSSGSGTNYRLIVTNKDANGFTVDFSSTITSSDYLIDWYLTDSTNSGIINLSNGVQEVTVPLTQTCSNPSNYVISATLRNTADASPVAYGITVIDQTPTSFTVRFSGTINSPNYYLEWFVCEGEVRGNYSIMAGITEATISLPSAIRAGYPLLITMASDDPGSSVYTPLVTNKTDTEFTVQFSSAIDNTGNYYVSWIVPEYVTGLYDSFEYYQTGGFRDFDSEGSFDCTHGFDLVNITIEDVENYILLEDGFKLTQEDGFDILL